MRRFFIFLFIFFASLFFSQCEIGEISFALEDVLMFFKVEGKNKENEIQQIDSFEIKAAEKPENEIELEAKKRPENEIETVYQMNVLKKPRPENVVQDTNKFTILKQEKPENIVTSIDEIVIKAAEKPENEIQEIDKFELEAAKKPANVVESIDEIVINADEKPENGIQKIAEIELKAAKKPANVVESIDEIVINADERPENKIQKVYEMNVLKVPRPKNIPQITNNLIIFKQEKPENIVESIDEIVINAAEKPENGIQKIAEFELKAKEKEQNIIQNIQKISIPAKQRHENEIQEIDKFELLGIEKPQINLEKINGFCLSEVARPENENEKKDEILIEGGKKEDLQIEIVNNLLFSKKEQQKNTNELCNGDEFQILCAEKKNQNIICKNEQFEIISERSGKLKEISQILEEKKEMADEYKDLGGDEEYIKEMLKTLEEYEKSGENQNIIEKKETFQINGKESAKVIELRQKTDAMLKVLQEDEKRHNEVLEVLKKDGMDEILKTSENADAAIPKIMELVKEKRMKAGKDMTKENILDAKEIEEFREGNDDFKRELEEKFSGFTENFKKFGEELSKFDIEHKKIIDENKVLRDELVNIKAASNFNKGVDLKGDVKNGINNSQIKEEEKENNEIETPFHKKEKEISKKYKESGIIFSNNNTQKKNFRLNSGYSRDKNSIYDPDLKEERMSILSSISKKLNFRTSSYSPHKNNRNSFLPFFDGKKFYTDPREQKTIICENIYDIQQEDGYLGVFDVNILNKKERNVSIDFEVCHETSFQIQNGNEAMKLNNIKEVRNTNKKKIVKTINIKKKRGRVGIDRKKRTTVGYRGNVIKKLCLKKFKNSKLNVAGKKLGPRTSFNTINNKSNTSLSNSGMYVDKMGDKNIINNTFVQKKIKNNHGMFGENVKKDIKRFSYFGGGVKEDVKKQIYIEKDLLKEKKDTIKSRLPQKKNDEVMKKNYAKISVFQQQEKTSGAHPENQKIQQKKINIPKKIDVKEKNCGVLIKKVLNNVGNKMPRTSINLTKNMGKSVITKNGKNSNNNSNSFVSLEGNENSINVNELRLNKKIKGGKKKDNLQEEKKDTQKLFS